jgi:hypothetical protein
VETGRFIRPDLAVGSEVALHDDEQEHGVRREEMLEGNRLIKYMCISIALAVTIIPRVLFKEHSCS